MNTDFWVGFGTALCVISAILWLMLILVKRKIEQDHQ